MWYKRLTPLLLFLIVFQGIPIQVLAAGVSQQIPVTNPSVENCGVLSFLFGCQANTQSSTSVIGIQGLQGPTGAQGGNNTRWWTGTGAPSDGLGSDNDFYLEDNGAVYCKTAGTWGASLLSIIGPAGPPGGGGGGDIGPIFALIQENKSAAILEADQHISTNLTGSGATAAQILELEDQFNANDTSHQAAIEGFIQENKSAEILWASDSDTVNDTHWHNDAILAAVANDTAAGMTAANMLEVETQFAANDTSTLNQGILAHVANDTSTLNHGILASNWNISQSVTGWQSNLSALNATIDARILGNASSGMTAADILEVETQFAANDTSTLNEGILAHIANDTSTLNQGILAHVANDTATLAIADAHIATNVSAGPTGPTGPAGAGYTGNATFNAISVTYSLLSGQTHVTLFNAPLNSTIVSVTANVTDAFDGTPAPTTITTYYSGGEYSLTQSIDLTTEGTVQSAGVPFLLSGDSTGEVFIGLDGSSFTQGEMIVRYSYINNQIAGYVGPQGPPGPAGTAGTFSAADWLEVETQFGLNDTSTLNQAIISASANTSSTAPAVLAATPPITGNRTGAVNDALSSTWTNLSLLINSTFSDNAKAAAIKWGSDSDTANRTGEHNDGILASNWNISQSVTGFQSNLSALNATIDARIAGNISSGMTAANWVEVEDQIKYNDTAVVRTAAEMALLNKTAAERTAAEMALLNRTTAERTAAGMMTANLSELSHWVALNRTEIFAGTWTNLSLLINSSYRTGAANDAAVAAKANRTLWGNLSIMAQSMTAGTKSDDATLYAPNISLGPVPKVYLGFPRGQYNASIDLIMPSGWTGGALTPTFYWTADSGAGTIEWDFSARCSGDNGALASYFGANTTVLDTMQTKDNSHIIQGAATTPSGSPAASAYCQLLFRRLSGAGTLTTEAKLAGVQVAYPTY